MYVWMSVNSDSETMEEWIYTINLASACYSKEENCLTEELSSQSKRASSHIAMLGTLRRMVRQTTSIYIFNKAVNSLLNPNIFISLKLLHTSVKNEQKRLHLD